MAGLNASSADVGAAIQSLADENGTGPAWDQKQFTSAIKSMNTEFKNMVVSIAQDSTPEEKKAMRSQLREYKQYRKDNIHSMIAERKMNRKMLREMLRENASVEDVVEELE